MQACACLHFIRVNWSRCYVPLLCFSLSLVVLRHAELVLHHTELVLHLVLCHAVTELGACPGDRE